MGITILPKEILCESPRWETQRKNRASLCMAVLALAHCSHEAALQSESRTLEQGEEWYRDTAAQGTDGYQKEMEILYNSLRKCNIFL